MKTLILMRHAHAMQGDDDHARGLSARGKQECQRVAGELGELSIQLDHVLCSSATRAQQTAQLVSDALAFTGTIESQDALYEASALTYLRALEQTKPSVSTLLFVAHNPSVSDLIRMLQGTKLELDPAGYVVIRHELAWAELERLG